MEDIDHHTISNILVRHFLTKTSRIKLLKNDQARYFGYVLKGKKHGKGVLIAPGCYYEGEFFQDKMKGLGHLEDFKKGILYDGQMINNRREGLGYLDTEVFSYFGYFENDIFNGIGLLQTPSKEIRGYFQNNILNGYGSITNIDTNRVIESSFVDGKPGIFSIETQPGSEYRGELIGGCRSGFGQFIKKDEVYTGCWKDDQRSGYGKQQLSDGILFIGQFFNDRRKGIGHEYDESGTYDYIGTFGYNKRNGFGQLRMEEYIYNGGWSSNKRNGIGELRSKDELNQDVVYFGYWHEDRRSGLGIYFTKKSVIKAEWDEDLLHGRVYTEERGHQPQYQKFSKGSYQHSIKSDPKKFLELFGPLSLDNFKEYVSSKIDDISKILSKGKVEIESKKNSFDGNLELMRRKYELDLQGFLKKHNKNEIIMNNTGEMLRGACLTNKVIKKHLRTRAQKGLGIIELKNVMLEYNTVGTLFRDDKGDYKELQMDLKNIQMAAKDSHNKKEEAEDVEELNESRDAGIIDKNEIEISFDNFMTVRKPSNRKAVNNDSNEPQNSLTEVNNKPLKKKKIIRKKKSKKNKDKKKKKEKESPSAKSDSKEKKPVVDTIIIPNSSPSALINDGSLPDTNENTILEKINQVIEENNKTQSEDHIKNNDYLDSQDNIDKISKYILNAVKSEIIASNNEEENNNDANTELISNDIINSKPKDKTNTSLNQISELIKQALLNQQSKSTEDENSDNLKENSEIINKDAEKEESDSLKNESNDSLNLITEMIKRVILNQQESTIQDKDENIKDNNNQVEDMNEVENDIDAKKGSPEGNSQIKEYDKDEAVLEITKLIMKSFNEENQKEEINDPKTKENDQLDQALSAINILIDRTRNDQNSNDGDFTPLEQIRDETDISPALAALNSIVKHIQSSKKQNSNENTQNNISPALIAIKQIVEQSLKNKQKQEQEHEEEDPIKKLSEAISSDINKEESTKEPQDLSLMLNAIKKLVLQSKNIDSKPKKEDTNPEDMDQAFSALKIIIQDVKDKNKEAEHKDSKKEILLNTISQFILKSINSPQDEFNEDNSDQIEPNLQEDNDSNNNNDLTLNAMKIAVMNILKTKKSEEEQKSDKNTENKVVNEDILKLIGNMIQQNVEKEEINNENIQLNENNSSDLKSAIKTIISQVQNNKNDTTRTDEETVGFQNQDDNNIEDEDEHIIQGEEKEEEENNVVDEHEESSDSHEQSIDYTEAMQAVNVLVQQVKKSKNNNTETKEQINESKTMKKAIQNLLNMINKDKNDENDNEFEEDLVQYPNEEDLEEDFEQEEHEDEENTKEEMNNILQKIGDLINDAVYDEEDDEPLMENGWDSISSTNRSKDLKDQELPAKEDDNEGKQEENNDDDQVKLQEVQNIVDEDHKDEWKQEENNDDDHVELKEEENNESPIDKEIKDTLSQESNDSDDFDNGLEQIQYDDQYMKPDQKTSFIDFSRLDKYQLFEDILPNSQVIKYDTDSSGNLRSINKQMDSITSIDDNRVLVEGINDNQIEYNPLILKNRIISLIRLDGRSLYALNEISEDSFNLKVIDQNLSLIKGIKGEEIKINDVKIHFHPRFRMSSDPESKSIIWISGSDQVSISNKMNLESQAVQIPIEKNENLSLQKIQYDDNSKQIVFLFSTNNNSLSKLKIINLRDNTTKELNTNKLSNINDYSLTKSSQSIIVHSQQKLLSIDLLNQESELLICDEIVLQGGSNTLIKRIPFQDYFFIASENEDLTLINYNEENKEFEMTHKIEDSSMRKLEMVETQGDNLCLFGGKQVLIYEMISIKRSQQITKLNNQKIDNRKREILQMRETQ